MHGMLRKQCSSLGLLKFNCLIYRSQQEQGSLTNTERTLLELKISKEKKLQYSMQSREGKKNQVFWCIYRYQYKMRILFTCKLLKGKIVTSKIITCKFPLFNPLLLPAPSYPHAHPALTSETTTGSSETARRTPAPFPAAPERGWAENCSGVWARRWTMHSESS